MSRSQRLKSIEELMARYCYAHDERRLELLATCLASTVSRYGAVGRDEVMEKYREIYERQSSTRRRHVLTNFLMLEDGESAARVQAYETFYLIRDDEVELHLTGVYRVDAVLEEGEWKIRDI